MGPAYSGTPWSGQEVKWYWITLRELSPSPVCCIQYYATWHLQCQNASCFSLDSLINTQILVLTHHQLNGPDGVVCKDVLFHHGDIEWTIALATPTFRPVLLTFLGSTLLDICYHGNSPDLLLPHQSPKVSDSVWKGTWG